MSNTISTISWWTVTFLTSSLRTCVQCVVPVVVTTRVTLASCSPISCMHRARHVHTCTLQCSKNIFKDNSSWMSLSFLLLSFLYQNAVHMWGMCSCAHMETEYVPPDFCMDVWMHMWSTRICSACVWKPLPLAILLSLSPPSALRQGLLLEPRAHHELVHEPDCPRNPTHWGYRGLPCLPSFLHWVL